MSKTESTAVRLAVRLDSELAKPLRPMYILLSRVARNDYHELVEAGASPDTVTHRALDTSNYYPVKGPRRYTGGEEMGTCSIDGTFVTARQSVVVVSKLIVLRGFALFGFVAVRNSPLGGCLFRAMPIPPPNRAAKGS